MKAIIELQKRAMDSSTDIVELLRYAYAIAEELEMHDFAVWSKAELEGYSDKDVLPEYRTVRGAIKILSSYGSTFFLRFDDPKIKNILSTMNFPNNVESLKKIMSEKGDFVIANFMPEKEEMLMKLINDTRFVENIYLSIHKVEFENTFSMIRQIILNWILECKKQGILGNEWIFTDQEKAMAQNVTNYNNCFSGDTCQTVVNQNSKETTINQTAQNMLVTKGDLQSLVTFLSDKGVSKPDIQEFKEIIESEPNITVDGVQNSKIQQWLGKIAVGGSLVAKGVAIDVIVEAIKQFF